MKIKPKNKKLSSLRMQISEQITKACKYGLHDIPYQAYSKSQNRIKKSVAKKFVRFELDILKYLKYQEKVYLFLYALERRSNDIMSEKDILELYFNTDSELIYKELPLKDKINQAQNILSKKVIHAKRELLDIYYIYKNVQMEGYRIGWNGSNDISVSINSTINKYFSSNSSYATSIDYYLLKKISDTKNFDDAYDLYYKNLDKLLDVTFIKVNSGQKGTFLPVNLYKQFASIKDVSKNLYSPFYGGKVNFVSGMTTQLANSRSFNQRNISLDSNTVSFIRSVFDERKSDLPDEILDSIRYIHIIKSKASTFDFAPYILENYTFFPNNRDKVIETLTSVEKYFYPKDEWCRIDNINKLKLLLEQHKFFDEVKKEYFIGYVLLLSMTFIHFKFNKMAPLQKLKNFCLYMDTVLFVFREPFVEVAYNFFLKSNQYKFFKKIQRNAKDMIKNLKNMAWDVFHLWSLEANCSVVDDGADLLVPYFYCFDKGLLELKECFDLETLFVNQRTGERICFYHKHSYPLELLEEYKSIEKEKIRREKFTNENIAFQIEYLENEIQSLW